MDDSSAPTFMNMVKACEERAERFERGALAQALAKDAAGRYLLSPAELPALFFNDTPSSADAIRDFVATVGHPEILEQYGASLLQHDAETDGVYDLTRVLDWESRYASALSALPGLRARVKAVKESTLELAVARATSQAAAGAILNSAAGLFVEHDPATATGKLFKAPDTALAMREVLDHLGGDQPSIDGLRKCVVDYIRDEVGVTRERAADYVAFFDANETALFEVFDAQQMGICRNIYQQLQHEVSMREVAPRRSIRTFFSKAR